MQSMQSGPFTKDFFFFNLGPVWNPGIGIRAIHTSAAQRCHINYSKSTYIHVLYTILPTQAGQLDQHV